MKTAFAEHMKGIIKSSSVNAWRAKFATESYRKKLRDTLNKKANEIGISITKVNIDINIKKE